MSGCTVGQLWISFLAVAVVVVVVVVVVAVLVVVVAVVELWCCGGCSEFLRRLLVWEEVYMC